MQVNEVGVGEGGGLGEELVVVVREEMPDI